MNVLVIAIIYYASIGRNKMATFSVMLTHTVVEVYKVEASNPDEACSKAVAGEGVLEKDWHLAYDEEMLVMPDILINRSSFAKMLEPHLNTLFGLEYDKYEEAE